MMRVLLWKEYREHRAIWVTLALGGGAALYGLSQLLGPVWGLNYQSARDSLQAVAVLLAWAYGLVCGAMLLANEAETGTLAFLDMLPVQRIEVWFVKCLAGLLLLLTQIAVLITCVVGLQIAETPTQLFAIVVGMLVLGLLAMAWSLLFSAKSESVLNVIGLSFVGQIAGILAIMLLYAVVSVVLFLMGFRNADWLKYLGGCCALLILTIGPIAGSARWFTQLDRARRRSHTSPFLPAVSLSNWETWKRLLWLNYAQMRRLLIGLPLFSLALGFLVLLAGPVGWPIVTLFIGVICGVTVWSDEQFSSAFRFLGDQRFPLGRIWMVKIGLRFALAVLASLVLLVPSLFVAIVHRVEAESLDAVVPFFTDVLHSSLVGPIVPAGIFLFLWVVYGFTTGQLCALLFRKSLVAGVVALGSASLLVCLWMPSLLGIGLHLWQVAGAPLALLLAGWLMMPAWVADRLLTRGTFVRLGSVLLLGGVSTTAGICYRVYEIPDVPEPAGMPEYIGSIPPLDKNKNPAGMAILNAWSQVNVLSERLYFGRRRPEVKFLFEEFNKHGTPITFSLEVDAALSRGWPTEPDPTDLSIWLDRIFQESWYPQLSEAASHPLGAVENLKQMTFADPVHRWGNVLNVNRLLAVRGLQQQIRKEPESFVKNLRISLALSRNLQHFVPPAVTHTARRAEVFGIAALDHWLEHLSDHPELLERVRDILLEHEAEVPSEADAIRASYLIARNSLDSVPEALVRMELAHIASRLEGFGSQDSRDRLKAEVELAALFWRIPWERTRHERILRVAFQTMPLTGRRTPGPLTQAHHWGGSALVNLVPLRLEARRSRDVALLHAAQLKAALRLYQARNQGNLPPTLDALVPRYLPAVPLDPFDGKPFRYRISQGEQLPGFGEVVAPGQLAAAAWGGPAANRGEIAARPPQPAEEKKFVPAGQAILWCVGEDGQDDGGTQQGLPRNPTNAGEDLIYLVPVPAKPKP